MYGYKFTSAITEDSRWSAAQIIPWIIEKYHPESMVDLGCCQGAWLEAAEANGIKFVLGIDGPYIDTSQLLIDPEKFIPQDLEAGMPQTAEVFDCALCLEVAEHLTPETGGKAVRWLCEHAKVVVWSAAIPGQAGVNHINEQWPSYWRTQFGNLGFFPDFRIRDQFWDNREVGFCLRQNLLVYHKEANPNNTRAMDVVHPALYGFKIFGWNNKW